MLAGDIGLCGKVSMGLNGEISKNNNFSPEPSRTEECEYVLY
jgi:hypothetical protein